MQLNSKNKWLLKKNDNELSLHNCMLDSRESTNVMPLKVMEMLGLRTTKTCRIVCSMDAREVKAFGII
jgi:hypothetical protein